MNYYQIIPDSDTYDSLRILAKNSLEIYKELSNTKPIENWLPVPVSIVKMKLKGDFPSMSGLVSFSEKALLTLKPIIKESVQVLPLQCKTGTFYAIKVLEKASLDFDKVEVDRSSSGRIIEIDKYAFKKETVIGKNIFTIEELTYSRPIVSEAFIEVVEQNKLEGLTIKKVWQME